MVIRPETPGDAAAVDGVVAAAFASPAHAELVVALRSEPSYRPARALVAVADDEVVGFVMVTDSTVDDGAGRIATLSPLAVAPERQRRGIGAALVAAVLEVCRADGEPAVALEGDPGYYGRLGFVPAAPFGLVLPLPGWAPAEAAQLAVLGDPAAVPSGVVRYAPPFASFD